MPKRPLIRYPLQRNIDRIRHSRHLLQWADFQADRLGTDRTQILMMLRRYTALEIEQIPAGPPPPAPPVYVSGSTISGSSALGSTLTSSDGSWTGDLPITYSYKWLQNGLDIGASRVNTYKLYYPDMLSRIACEITASNIVGTSKTVTKFKFSNRAVAVAGQASSFGIYDQDSSVTGTKVTSHKVEVVGKIGDHDLPVLFRQGDFLIVISNSSTGLATSDLGVKWNGLTSIATNSTWGGAIPSSAIYVGGGLFVASTDGLLAISHDGGGTWPTVISVLGYQTNILTMVCNYLTSAIMIGGGGYSNPTTLAVSKDAGVTWTNSNLSLIDASLANINIRSIATINIPGVSVTLAVGSGGLVLRSYDFGTTWELIKTLDIDPTWASSQAMSVIWADDRFIIGSSDGKIAWTLDNGDSYQVSTHLQTTSYGANAASAMCYDGDLVYAIGGAGSSIAISADKGDTWSVDSGFSTTDFGTALLSSIGL